MTEASRSSMRLHGLDTLRALAIVQVMLYHLNLQGLLPEALGPVARMGWVGVDLFFVLSGYLIGSQLLRPYVHGGRPSLREFYARRAYRILPAFFVVLALYLVVPVWRESPGPYASWQYASFTWNLLLLGYPEHRAFSHVWSLCVEEHFYLVLPMLILAMMRRPSAKKTVAVLAAIFLGGIALRASVLHFVIGPAGDDQGLLMMKYIYYPTYTRLDGLVVGVGLALMQTFRTGWWSRVTRHGALLVLGGVGAVMGALWMCGFEYPSPELPLSILFAFPALACGFGLLVASAASGQGWMGRRVPGTGALAALAYSLYLTHKPVAHATHVLLPRATAHAGWQACGIYTVACVGVAAGLYFAVERPFLALRVRRSERRTAAGVDGEVRLDPAI
jgi:peptidoglycan/LPS O-acetylase OafA/YrhL